MNMNADRNKMKYVTDYVDNPIVGGNNRAKRHKPLWQMFFLDNSFLKLLVVPYVHPSFAYPSNANNWYIVHAVKPYITKSLLFVRQLRRLG